MNIKSKEIKVKIAKGLESQLGQNNFVYRKTNNEFVSELPELCFIFNMLLTAWSDHYSLDIRLYISHKKVEKIYESIVGKSHKLTIGNTIERIYKSPDGKQIVNGNMTILLFQDEDIEAAVETLINYYENIAKPYFASYHSLEAINTLLNNPPYDYCPAHVGGSLDNRCMKGLIVARLANDSNFEHLVSVYDEAIKKTMSEESIQKYRKVKEYLSSSLRFS